MLADIRQSSLHAPYTASKSADFAGGSIVTDTGIQMYDPRNVLIVYRYDAANQRLLAIVNGESYPLLEGVQNFTVTMEPMRSAESVRTGGSWDLLERATLLLTLKTNDLNSTPIEGPGGLSLTLSASVMPRRNAW